MAYNETPTKGPAMFLKNREFRIKMVKTPQTEDDAPEMETRIHVDPEQIAKITKGLVKHAAIALGTIIVVSKVLDTLSEIAVKKTKSKDTK